MDTGSDQGGNAPTQPFSLSDGGRGRDEGHADGNGVETKLLVTTLSTATVAVPIPKVAMPVPRVAMPAPRSAMPTRKVAMPTIASASNQNHPDKDLVNSVIRVIIDNSTVMDMRTLKNLSLVNKIVRRAASKALFRNMTVKANGIKTDSDKITYILEHDRIKKAVRNLRLLSPWGWRGQEPVESGRVFPSIKGLVNALPNLTTLSLSEFSRVGTFFNLERFANGGPELVLPSVKTLTLHLAVYNRVGPIVKACPNITTLRMNYNGFTPDSKGIVLGPLTGGNRNVSEVWAAIKELRYVENLELLKFGSQRTSASGTPDVAMVGWYPYEVQTISEFLPGLKRLALYGNILNHAELFLADFGPAFACFTDLEEVLITIQVMADWKPFYTPEEGTVIPRPCNREAEQNLTTMLAHHKNDPVLASVRIFAQCFKLEKLSYVFEEKGATYGRRYPGSASVQRLKLFSNPYFGFYIFPGPATIYWL